LVFLCLWRFTNIREPGAEKMTENDERVLELLHKQTEMINEYHDEMDPLKEQLTNGLISFDEYNKKFEELSKNYKIIEQIQELIRAWHLGEDIIEARLKIE
jgi:hypothetical protein